MEIKRNFIAPIHPKLEIRRNRVAHINELWASLNENRTNINKTINLKIE